MTSDHAENEINLKSELSTIAMGQFFAKSFKHRLSLHGVQESCRSNFGIVWLVVNSVSSNLVELRRSVLWNF
jgi:hypothetical protein